MALSDPFLGDITFLELLIFILFIAIVVVIARILYYLMRRYLDSRISKKSSKGISRLVQYVIFFTAFYIGFVLLLHQDLNSLFVSLGIIGLAVALAAQQVLENVFAGILISLSKPFELEDWVDVGGVPTTKIARVRDMSLMFTELKDIDGRTITLPNAFMMTNKVVNYSKAGFIAFDIPIVLRQGADLGKAYSIVLHEADVDENILPNLSGEEKRAMKGLLERPHIKAIFGDRPDMKIFEPQLNVVKLEESRITLNVRVWVKDPQRMDSIRSRFLEILNRRFKEEGIGLADE
ncbi:MAG: mechanosensitive ion channel family protein [Euryarchaeota archaeon]|nr:mechanosensitive ion channel family protein [Euryarchaeota archaeon]